MRSMEKTTADHQSKDIGVKLRHIICKIDMCLYNSLCVCVCVCVRYTYPHVCTHTRQKECQKTPLIERKRKLNT